MYINPSTLLKWLLLTVALINTPRLMAQPNPVANYGFEAASSPTSWTTTNHAGTSSIVTSNMRSGARGYSNAMNSTTTTGYVENATSINVPNNQYLILIAYYRVSASNTTSRVQLGISGDMGTAVTPAANATYYQITRAIQNTTGSTQAWEARINMYKTSGLSRTFIWDDVIAYTSTSSTVDLTEPTSATNATVSYAGTSASLSWTNGTDGGSGIARTVILRRTVTGCSTTEPTLVDQTIYSKSGGYGINTVGSWTVLDTVNSNTTTYTDNTIVSGGSYAYAIVHEDLAYNHSPATLLYIPVAAVASPTSPTNNQTGVSTLTTFTWPAACAAATYDVYLSTNQTDVNNASSTCRVSTGQTGLTYTHSTPLTGYTDYWWKVVPKNAAGTSASSCPTWKITTGVAALSYDITRTEDITYNSIMNSGNNLVWSGTYNADDKMSDALDLTTLGFTGFTYQETNITSLKVNTNGFITFNTSSSASYTNTFSGEELIVAPFWEDLVCQGYISGQAQAVQRALLESSVKYLITGTAGNQVLTIEWSEMEIYSNAGPSINFQLKLYESDDHIEFIYGKMYGFNGTTNYTYTYSCGISGSVVASSPLAGELICQQIPNVRNFSNSNTTSLSELPDCYTMLTLTPDATPSSTSESERSITNDECAGAIALPIQYGLQNDFCQTYTSKPATASASVPACTALTAGNADDDVWFKFTVTTAGDYAITVNGSGSYNPVVQLISGNCASMTVVGCVNATSSGLIETLTADDLVEGTYFIRVYDQATGAGGSGNFAISVYNVISPPSNDDCAGATTLTIGAEVNSGNTANATTSASIATCGAASPGTPDDDVWYKFTATSTTTRLSVNGGSSYNAVLQYFSGTCGSLTNLGCISSTGAAGIEYTDITTVIGTTYFIRVYHSAAGATPISGFSIVVSNPVPVCPVLSSPADGVININKSNAQSFSWSATTSPSVGTKTYTIQISTDPTFATTVSIPNATGLTSTSYNLTANTLATSTMYYWRVLAVNVNGTSSGCSYNSFATTGTPPSCASDLSPEAGTTNAATSTTLSWVAGSGSPTSYDVYLSTTQSLVSSLNASARVSTGQTGTTYNATGLSNNTTYYWTIIPKKTGGSASGCFVNSFTTIAAAPANDNCAGATSINPTSSTPVAGTVLNATQSSAGLVGTADDDVWYKFTAVSTAHNIAVAPSSVFNAVVQLYSGSCGSLTSVSCINAGGNGVTENVPATGLTIGQTYYIRVYDFASGTPSDPTFTIRVNDIDMGISSFVSPSNNNCGNTTVTVALHNYSVASINFATNPVTVSGSALSPANVTTSFGETIINSGTLASGATLQVTLTSAYSVIDAGSYHYTATAVTEGDNNESNNTISATLQQISLPSPFILTGTGSYCAGGSGVTFTLSGSESGTTYQLFRSSTAESSVVPGTGSAIVFNNVTTDGAYRVVATSTSTNCNSYMSASAVVTVNPLWLGVNTNWNDPANWCGNVVPSTNANIIISGSAANMPALPGDITVNNLELTESNKRVDLNGRVLTINGTISGSGVVRGSSTSSIVINGSGNMGSLRMDQTTAGTTNVLQNLSVNIGNNATSNYVTLDNALVVKGTITLSNGNLNANGNLTLASDASGTARIAAIASTADITGNVISQRYVPSVIRRYRMLSPNTSSFTYADIKDDMFVTGSGGATNGFDASTPNSASIFTYQESTTGGRGWKAVTNITQSLNSGSGAIVFVRGDRTLSSPQWYTPPFVSQNAVTVDFVGAVNKGNYSPTITYTNTGVSSDDGWNLVGNPYPSQIDWALVTKSNLNPFIYILDPSTNGYVANDGSTPIASGQAFFVQANAASPTITFTESCKTATSANALFKTGPAPKFTVRMVQDSINSDVAWLRFVSGASAGFSPAEDALKFTNSSINMGYRVDGNDLQINTYPELINTADTFVMFANAPINNYTFEFSNFDAVPLTKSIFLRDLFNNTITDLRLNATYAFSITSNVNSKGNRFQIIIIDNSALPVEFMGLTAELRENDDVLVKWYTASETNNEKFVVERSYDNVTFEPAGVVKGAGKSNIRLAYALTDKMAAARASDNVIYYRIRQFDFSGENRVSNVSVLHLNEMYSDPQRLVVYPNPASDKVTVESEQGSVLGKVTICDITGKVVKEVTADTHQVLIETQDLNKGIYFIRLQFGKTQKLILE